MAEQNFKLIRVDEDKVPVELVINDDFNARTLSGDASLVLFDQDGEEAHVRVSSYSVRHVPGIGGELVIKLYFTATEVTR